MRISDWSSDVCSSDLTVGRVEQLPEKGSFFTKTIEIWNAPIVVTRGSDDRIQAFYNVCAHRGNQVVLTERGRASRFSCNYHNWVYQIGRAHVRTPVTNAHLVCRLLLEKKKTTTTTHTYKHRTSSCSTNNDSTLKNSTYITLRT